MANTKYIGQNEDHDGNVISNFVLWLLTSANVILKVVKKGMIAFDTTLNKVVVHDGTIVRELDYKQKQKEISDDYSITSDDYGYILFLDKNAGLTVTIDDVSPEGFYCELINIGAGSVTLEAGTATVVFPDGTTLEQNKICTIFKRDDSGSYYVKGELT